MCLTFHTYAILSQVDMFSLGIIVFEIWHPFETVGGCGKNPTVIQTGIGGCEGGMGMWCREDGVAKISLLGQHSYEELGLLL